MQTLKDDIRQRIVAVAREEFIAHDARSTSIRTVARRAGIAAGNVYNYFRSKDELFCEVLHPLIDALNRYLLSHNEEQHLSIEVFSVRKFQDEYIMAMRTLVKNFRPELRLLLFHAESTSLAGYKERIIEHQTRIGKEYLRLMKARYPHINIDISPFFLHIASSMWVNIFCELVEHEDYDESEVNRALEQYVAYSMAGWRELMKP
ncbi:TetR family transcriptional regulator [Prevotella sp. oral taxon 376]|uniref:TetR/AcrR family transcriptional regulator n=1 Tax=Prevotella sp. oral taxon 376 TaxID=712466 RepID=UPI000D1F6A22|nr:TetR/AcrR family transcriptional regulator [Prevotella sp. oral taxon 376]PTL34516.1 TetR family transcriptional regulator [Prevotella sp. oral taxon 376]